MIVNGHDVLTLPYMMVMVEASVQTFSETIFIIMSFRMSHFLRIQSMLSSQALVKLRSTILKRH